MGTVGDCYDHAPMESFWGSMQIELLDRQRWRTNLELAVAMADYIEHLSTTRPVATAPSVTSRRTNMNNYTHVNPRPRCHKTWSTKWGQAHLARSKGRCLEGVSKGFEPPNLLTRSKPARTLVVQERTLSN